MDPSEQFASPDGSGLVALVYAGEIRFGPRYYFLRVNGTQIADRVFGGLALWSPDSEYVAVQEWLSTSEADGPQTSLVCIQPKAGRRCEIARTLLGYIEPKEFSRGKLFYTIEEFPQDSSQMTDHEIDMESLSRWETL
jgi:hypothetical protein